MTLASLKKRVEFWQERLSPLGFATWRPNVSIVDDPDNDSVYSARAAVMNSSYYDEFWMEFAREWLNDPGTTQEEIDRVIIHEFIHVAMRDFDDAIHDCQAALGQPAQGIWQRRVKHEREGFVDRVARTVYLQYTSSPDSKIKLNVVRSRG